MNPKNVQNHYLPIKKNDALLKEYGRAVAWISMIEDSLTLLTYFKGKLNKANGILINNLFEKKTLGQKIVLIREIKLI